jgi:hypothetical protein
MTAQIGRQINSLILNNGLEIQAHRFHRDTSTIFQRFRSRWERNRDFLSRLQWLHWFAHEVAILNCRHTGENEVGYLRSASIRGSCLFLSLKHMADSSRRMR